MTTTGPVSAGTRTNNTTVGTENWAIGSPDTFAPGTDTQSYYLWATGFDFSAIPDTDNIVAILVTVNRNASILNRISDYSARLIVGGAAGGAEKAVAGTWSNSDEDANYGDLTADTHGYTGLVGIDVKNNFGFALSVNGQAAAEARVNLINITIVHSPGASGVEVAVTTATLELLPQPVTFDLGSPPAGVNIDVQTAVLEIVPHPITIQAPGDALLIGVPTPLPITADSVNEIDHVLGTISHSILASSNPGAESTILKSSDSGFIQLVRIGVGKDPVQPLDILGNIQLTGSLMHPADLTIIASGGDVLFEDSDISAHNWISGTTGWGIQHDGDADFRNLSSDSLNVAAFVADTNLALAGSQLITKSVAILSRPFTIPPATPGSNDVLYVYDLPGFENSQVFADGDYVRLRYIDRSGGSLIVGDVWGTVSGFIDLPNGEQSWTWTYVSGSSGQVIGAGGTALDYGQSGDGYWHTTTLDPSGSPYAEVGTWITDPSLVGNHTVHLRIGHLDGITGVGNEWGLWTGQDTDKYLLLSDVNFEAHGLRLSLYDSDSNEALRLDPNVPYLAIGQPLPSGPDAGGVGLWVGQEGGSYKFRVGNPSGTALRWDGAALKIRDSNNNNVIVLDANGNSYFAAPMTLGINGGIYQGTGSFGTPTTGLKIWRDGNIGRIGGYNAGTLQWYAATNGKLYAGGGNVVIDNNGVSIADGSHWPATNAKNKLRFGPGVGEIFATSGLDSTRFRLQMPGGEAYIQFTNEIISDEYLTIGGNVYREQSSNIYEVCFPHFLNTKATSASYNGDSFSTGTNTIDLSASFGLPAGIKAINATLIVSSNSNVKSDYVWLSPAASPNNNQLKAQTDHGNSQVYQSGIVKCNASGDIFMTVSASTSVRVWIEIWAIYL